MGPFSNSNVAHAVASRMLGSVVASFERRCPDELPELSEAMEAHHASMPRSGETSAVVPQGPIFVGDTFDATRFFGHLCRMGPDALDPLLSARGQESGHTVAARLPQLLGGHPAEGYGALEAGIFARLTPNERFYVAAALHFAGGPLAATGRSFVIAFCEGRAERLGSGVSQLN